MNDHDGSNGGSVTPMNDCDGSEGGFRKTNLKT